VFCAQAQLPLLATATILETSPAVCFGCPKLVIVFIVFQDPSNLARILRLPTFLGEPGDKRDRKFARKVAAERRRVTAEEQTIAHQQTLQRLRGESVAEDDPQSELKCVHDEWVLDVKSRYEDRIVRRDLRSVRWDNATINESLPPKKVVVATCKLYEEEMELLDGAIDELQSM
jgi:hypothetical protein